MTRRRLLTFEQAQEIRALRERNPRVWSHRKLAARYGLTRSGIGDILSGLTYRAPVVPFDKRQWRQRVRERQRERNEAAKAWLT